MAIDTTLPPGANAARSCTCGRCQVDPLHGFPDTGMWVFTGDRKERWGPAKACTACADQVGVTDGKPWVIPAGVAERALEWLGNKQAAATGGKLGDGAAWVKTALDETKEANDARPD